MCQTHAKYIDGDESRFTAELLKEWKLIGEKVARRMQESRIDYLEAISQLSTKDGSINDLVLAAQKQDPLKKRYQTWDLAIYRKILEMIPKDVQWTAKQGGYVNRHHESVRKPLNYYSNYLENNPTDFSFIDKKTQVLKYKLDKNLILLNEELSLNTFIDKDGKHYAMSQEWKLSKAGSNNYTSAALRIYHLSEEFISAFDVLHKFCRDKFGE
ncbi:hypothetical protein GYA49_04520 [Candidatus Beckwithbacteria bacterium]|nr:hypothetical protein [Candidatus Beckwithbacteria bacterium]